MVYAFGKQPNDRTFTFITSFLSASVRLPDEAVESPRAGTTDLSKFGVAVPERNPPKRLPEGPMFLR